MTPWVTVLLRESKFSLTLKAVVNALKHTFNRPKILACDEKACGYPKGFGQDVSFFAARPWSHLAEPFRD